MDTIKAMTEEQSKPKTVVRKAAPQGRPQKKTTEKGKGNKGARPPSARRVALTLLISVLQEKQPFDAAWTRVMSPAGAGIALSTADRAFCRQLVATVLRRQGQIDFVLSHCLKRSLDPHAYRVQNMLRLGAAQLLFLRTPSHAAINETVGMAARLPKYKGMINAVLRRIDREKTALLEASDDITLNCPNWLFQSWCQAYGDQQAHDMVAACLNEPSLDFTLKAPDPTWSEQLGAEVLPTGSLRRREGGRVEDLPGYDKGEWWVQDAAAALPVLLMGDVAGKQILDMCAAPGGKLLQLAARGAKVTGLDNSKPRLRIVRRNLDRMKLQARLVCEDARQWKAPMQFDAILLDAPCSATGTIRRHPDVWRLKTSADIDRVGPVQDQLLDAAVQHLKPGGQLIYCTCSLQPQEGEDRIAQFLQQYPDFKIQRITPSEAGIDADWITEKGELRTLPSHLGGGDGGLDGFYVCRLQAPAASDKTP